MVRPIFFMFALVTSAAAQDQSDYYRTVTLETPPSVNMEASGLAVLPDGKLAVSLRKGEVWLIECRAADGGESGLQTLC